VNTSDHPPLNNNLRSTANLSAVSNLVVEIYAIKLKLKCDAR